MVTSFYAALLALLFIFLSVRTLLLRRRFGIALGHGDNPQMLRAMRVHANFAEYVPLALLLIFLVEQSGLPPMFVHLLAGALLVGRLLHAWGVSQPQEKLLFRVIGMAATFTVLGCAASWLLARALVDV